MRYIDYRKALGCGFDDSKKFELVNNKICIYLNGLQTLDRRTNQIIFNHDNFFIEIGEMPNGYNDIRDVISVIEKTKSIKELLAIYVIFCNYIQVSDYYPYNHFDIENPFDFVKRSLNDLSIPFEIFEDGDGSFIFPKGVPEFDDALVSDLFRWLDHYSKTKEIYSRTLRQISNKDNARDCADNLRKTFEMFLQEFFENNKNLDSNRSLVADYLTENNINSETNQMIQALINRYRLLNDKAVKHNDEIDVRSIEFLMYQTGLFMRLLIELRSYRDYNC